MRVIIFLILFLTSQLANAQSNPLFKIISCSEGVTLDGVEVKPGLIVYNNSIKLEIPKKGYAGVMTIEGYASSLKESVKVKVVNKRIEEYHIEINSRLPSSYDLHIILKIQGQEGGRPTLYGDSVFFSVFDRLKIGPPYSLVFKNLYEEVVFQDTLRSNWKTYSVRELLGNESALLFEVHFIEPVKENYNREIPQVIKLNPEKNADLDQQLGRLNLNMVEIAAIYELSHLEYDHLFQLYKIETTKNLNLDPISAAYLAKRREKYQLDQYNLK